MALDVPGWKARDTLVRRCAGMSRRTLLRKLTRYRIDKQRFRS
jgi:hypothetical protein